MFISKIFALGIFATQKLKNPVVVVWGGRGGEGGRDMEVLGADAMLLSWLQASALGIRILSCNL